jgi:hypothetical protein
MAGLLVNVILGSTVAVIMVVIVKIIVKAIVELPGLIYVNYVSAQVQS